MKGVKGSYTSPGERFWKYVEPMMDDRGCWEWLGARSTAGYGALRIAETKENVAVHRLSFEMHFGKIPDDLWVLHRCDNPSCVNPNHLFLGTTTDNMRDCSRKGRVRNQNSGKDVCSRGHLLDGENLGIRPNGARFCRQCRNFTQRVRRGGPNGQAPNGQGPAGRGGTAVPSPNGQAQLAGAGPAGPGP